MQEERLAINEKILFVDDEANVLDGFKRQLRNRFCVETALDAGQALEMIRSDGPYAVIVADMRMPDIDGIQLLRILRTAAPESVRMMLTGNGDQHTAMQAVNQGYIFRFLTKPCPTETLTEALDSGLAQYRLLQAVEREQHMAKQLAENYRRLQQIEEFRDDLMHMIVHDLRTPLTSLLAGLQTFASVGEINPTQQEFLDMALGGGHTLLEMINDLLDVSKMEAGVLTLERRIVTAERLIEEAFLQVSQLAGDKELRLVRRVGRHLPGFWADPDKLRRTLVNLLGNAIKFTPQGGRITVLAYYDVRNSGLLFAVRDTGEGIPREAFERIFERFGQVESRKAGRKMSTGLGLTFCKMAVEAHGGRIWVDSKPGKGSTFWFSLPVTPG